MVLRPDWILEKEQSIAKIMFMISTSFIEIFFKFPVLDLIIIVLNRFVSFNDLCLISHVLPGCKLKRLKLDFLSYQTLQNYFSTSAQHTCRWGVLQTRLGLFYFSWGSIFLLLHCLKGEAISRKFAAWDFKFHCHVAI